MIPRPAQPDSPLFTQRTFDRDEQSIDARFREYDRAHPEVFRKFRELADGLRAAGWSRYSADALMHRIRWHYHVERQDREWKINNDFSSRYARLLMDVDPSFVGFFETRVLKSRVREEGSA